MPTEATKYNEILELLSKAEMEARNGAWRTVGTYARQASEKAFSFALEEGQYRYEPTDDS